MYEPFFPLLIIWSALVVFACVIVWVARGLLCKEEYETKLLKQSNSNGFITLNGVDYTITPKPSKLPPVTGNSRPRFNS